MTAPTTPTSADNTGAVRLSRPLAQRTASLPSADVPLEESHLAEPVLAAAAAALRHGETHYTDRPGILPLRERVAEQINDRYAIGMTPKDITITCGIAEAYFVSLKILARADTYVVDLTASSTVQAQALLVGAKYVAPVQGETNAESLTDPCSVLILSTATTLNADDPWIRLAQAQNAYVIWVDASLSGAMTTAAPAFHPAQVEALRPHVVTIGGLDGDFAGWRIGWMCGSDVAEKLRSFKQSMTICSTAVSQWAAIEVLKGMKHG